MHIGTAKSLFIALILMFASAASAQTRIQQLGYDNEDGERVTGFVYKSEDTADNAPIVLLMHSLNASSLQWLAADNRSYGDSLVKFLIEKGYRVAALDARAHGARGEGDSPMARVRAARNGDTQAYRSMIAETVGDYRSLLDRLLEKDDSAGPVLVIGYSMGAQMATLLAAQDSRVTHLVTIVPPAVMNVPEVAPIYAAPKVNRPWLLLTADQDVFSSNEQNDDLEAAGGKQLSRVSFDSGHALPETYVSTVKAWLQDQQF